MHKTFYSRRKVRADVVTLICLLLGLVAILFPFIWSVSTSLQGPGLARVTPPQFFKPPYIWENYVKAYTKSNMGMFFKNSLLVAVFTIFGALLSNSLIGFGFARYKFKGSELLFFTVLTTMMIPANVTIIIKYMMWREVGALNTYIPIVLPSYLGGAMHTFLLRQFFKSVPDDFYAAAMIDGASPPKIWARVYMPLAKPVLATLTIRVFIGSWNNMFEPLIYLSSKEKYTISIGLLYLKNTFDENSEDTAVILAAALLAMIPSIIVYFFCQKQLVEGMVSAGIKA